MTFSRIILATICFFALPASAQAYVSEKASTYNVIQCWNPANWQGEFGLRTQPTFSGFTTSGRDDQGDEKVRLRGNLVTWGGRTENNNAIVQLNCQSAEDRFGVGPGGKHWMGAWRSGSDERRTRRGVYLRQVIRMPAGSSAASFTSRWVACRAGEPALPQIWSQPRKLDPDEKEEMQPIGNAEVGGYDYTRSALQIENGTSCTSEIDNTRQPRWGLQSDTSVFWSKGWNPNLSPEEYQLLLERKRDEYGLPQGIVANIMSNTLQDDGSTSLTPFLQKAMLLPSAVFRIGMLCSAPSSCTEETGGDWRNGREEYALAGDIEVFVFDTEAPEITAPSTCSGLDIGFFCYQGGARSSSGVPVFSPSQEGYFTYAAKDQGGGLQYAVIGNSDATRYQEEKLRNLLPPRQAWSGNAGRPGVSLKTSEAFLDSWTAVSSGDWQGNPEKFSFQWQVCSEASDQSTCRDIDGATRPQFFIPRSFSEGSFLRAKVTASNGEQAETVWSDTALLVRPSELDDPEFDRNNTLFGSPRVGQYLTMYYSNLPKTNNAYTVYRCNKNDYSSWSSCAKAGQVGEEGLYKVQPADAGHWLGVSAWDYDGETAYSMGIFPATSGDQFFSGRYPEMIGSDILPADVGILPAYSQAQALCDRSSRILTRRYQSTEPFAAEVSTRTNPCPQSMTVSFDVENSNEKGASNIWEEGWNQFSLQTYDFCTRTNATNCSSQTSEQAVGRLIWDSTAPVLSKDVQCLEPGGENGWHVEDPRCRFQSADRFLICAQEFPFQERNLSQYLFCRNGSSVATKEVALWQEEDGRSGEDRSSGPSTTEMQLSDGRPLVSVEVRDRAGNVFEKDYQNFARIDRQDPEHLRIVDGPSETELAVDEDGEPLLDQYQLPQPPDETNDLRGGAANPDETDEDCALCWTVVGLEESSGLSNTERNAVEASLEKGEEPTYPWDYDHPARLQCQLLYGGSGRTPAYQLADWVQPPWPVRSSWFSKGSDDTSLQGTISAEEPAVAGAVVYADTGWNCLQSDPFGDRTSEEETVAPFSMDGMPDGHYMFRVRQKDRAGNVGPWSGRPLVFDTSAPESNSLSRASISQTSAGNAPSEAGSLTKQWRITWGWDLLQRGSNAGIYCFVRNIDTREIVRRSGWGCGNSGSNGPVGEGWSGSVPAELSQSVETPMPWPGVEGEGRGTLAGLPDGRYEVGFIQRDRIGQRTDWENAATLPFEKSGSSIGQAPSPRITLDAIVDKETVTSRRTEATLRLRAGEILSDGRITPLLPGQAFFPMSGWIAHYTPQQLYSYCQDSMTNNYSEYVGEEGWIGKDKPIGPEDEVIDAVQCPDEYLPTVDQPQEVRWSGGLSLDPSTPSGVNSEQGTFTLNIFWLQPTSQNEPEADILGANNE